MTDTFDFFFSVFELIFGVYLLWCGFTRRGRVYAPEGIRAEKVDQYLKTTRIMCFVVGGVLTVLGVLEFFFAMQRTNGVENPTLKVAVSVLLILSFAAIVTMVVLARTMADKNKKRNARDRSHINMPSDAFDFEAEEGESKFQGTKPAQYKSKK